MPDGFTMAELYRGFSEMRADVATLKAGQTNLSRDLDDKHSQNRKDIHDIRGAMQTLVDIVTNLRIQNARWSVGAGILTAILMKVIDHLIK